MDINLTAPQICFGDILYLSDSATADDLDSTIAIVHVSMFSRRLLDIFNVKI